jgi:transposase
MIAFPANQRIFVHAETVDMRLGYDGLHNLVVNATGLDPTSGDLYVFINRNRNRMKILVWDHGGYWLLCKRLEKGRFPPVHREPNRPDIGRSDLLLMLDGIELIKSKKRQRYCRSKSDF